MSTKEKIKCKAIAIKIKNGSYGSWETEQDNVLAAVKEEYSLTTEMIDFIVVLMNENI